MRLWLAEADGRPVAGWYGFRLGGTDWYYQAGRDPGYERTSVGLVLLAHTVREACNDGLGTYALLRGGESYKDRFATRNPMFETLLVGRGVRGSVVQIGVRAAARLSGSQGAAPARRSPRRLTGERSLVRASRAHAQRAPRLRATPLVHRATTSHAEPARTSA